MIPVGANRNNPIQTEQNHSVQQKETKLNGKTVSIGSPSSPRTAATGSLSPIQLKIRMFELGNPNATPRAQQHQKAAANPKTGDLTTRMVALLKDFKPSSPERTAQSTVKNLPAGGIAKSTSLKQATLSETSGLSELNVNKPNQHPLQQAAKQTALALRTVLEKATGSHTEQQHSGSPQPIKAQTATIHSVKTQQAITESVTTQNTQTASSHLQSKTVPGKKQLPTMNLPHDNIGNKQQLQSAARDVTEALSTMLNNIKPNTEKNNQDDTTNGDGRKNSQPQPIKAQTATVHSVKTQQAITESVTTQNTQTASSHLQSKTVPGKKQLPTMNLPHDNIGNKQQLQSAARDVTKALSTMLNNIKPNTEKNNQDDTTNGDSRKSSQPQPIKAQTSEVKTPKTQQATSTPASTAKKHTATIEKTTEKQTTPQTPFGLDIIPEEGEDDLPTIGNDRNVETDSGRSNSNSETRTTRTTTNTDTDKKLGQSNLLSGFEVEESIKYGVKFAYTTADERKVVLNSLEQMASTAEGKNILQQLGAKGVVMAPMSTLMAKNGISRDALEDRGHALFGIFNSKTTPQSKETIVAFSQAPTLWNTNTILSGMRSMLAATNQNETDISTQNTTKTTTSTTETIIETNDERTGEGNTRRRQNAMRRNNNRGDVDQSTSSTTGVTRQGAIRESNPTSNLSRQGAIRESNPTGNLNRQNAIRESNPTGNLNRQGAIRESNPTDKPSRQGGIRENNAEGNMQRRSAIRRNRG